MPDSPVRVALLARPGEVRDQLRRALADCGAHLVAEGDPAELDPRTVEDGRPGVVVVSLEPAIEDALDRFESLLGASDVEVIYDDAEVTRQLDGWDLARWARHLAAKLAGGETVLPPAPPGAEQHDEPEISLEPGAPPTPAQEMDAERLEDYAAESLDLSDWVPKTPSLTDVVVEAEAPAAESVADEADTLDLDLAGLEEAMSPKVDSAPVEMLAPTPAADDFLDAATTTLADAPADFIETGAAADWTLAPAPADNAHPEAELDEDAPLELDDADLPVALADGDFADDTALDLDDDGDATPDNAAANLAAFGLSAADAPLTLADADAPLELAEASPEAAAMSADAPLEFADATADAPLDFADATGEAPLEFADAPLDFADATAEAPLDFADATADAPLDFADATAEAPLDFADEPGEFNFADDTGTEGVAGGDLPRELAEDASAPPVDAGADLGSLDALDLGLDVDLSALEASTAAGPVTAAPVAADEAADEPLLLDMELSDTPVKFSNFNDDEPGQDGGVDDDVAALAAQLDAFAAADQRGVAREPDFASLPPEPKPEPGDTRRAPAPAPGRTEASGPSIFASLELVPMDADLGKVTSADADTPPSPSLTAAPVRRSGMSLAAEDVVENNQTVEGALFVIAGLGGPDGVRQLLSALPPTLPVPVLLYQHLDTGKHERLVGQLAKASRLPLDLAIEGKLAFAGRVAVLQPGIGIARREQNIEFVRAENLAGVVAAMAAKDSVVLVLSGADPSVVPAVLALGAGGGMMLAQDPGSCFDPAAPQAVIAAGAATAPIADLAQKIVERWT